MAQALKAVTEETPEPDRDQMRWRKEIDRAIKHFDTFWKKADTLYKLYARQSDENDGKKKYAMLWANTEVMKPAIYARPPVPQVSRRYRDKDPVGRLAAELLERASSYEFERMNVDSVLRSVRDDLLLPGRGAVWMRYEADIEAPEAPEPQENAVTDAMGDKGEMDPGEVKGHRVVCDYIHYRQFLHQPVRRWEECGWVAKIVYIDDEEGKERFPDTWKGVELDNKADSSSDSDSIKDPALVDAREAKATVYEIWSKDDGKVYFVAKSCDHLLGVEEPFLKFEGFFPCPKPVYSTVTNNSLIPTPDYKYYQDQAEEVNQLTDRIDRLIDSLKLVGFYPAGAEGDVSSALEKALSPDTQNQMIPIASWAAFGERGGSNAIVWLPIKDVAETIKACVELRNQVIQDIYQITGISDILRGSTEASETATAQQIKAQWGSVRIRDRQQEMVRLARDITRMTCEIIAEEFDPEYVTKMANMELAPPPQMQPVPPPQPTGDPQQDQQAQQQAQQAQMQQQQQMQAWQAEQQKYSEAFAILKDDRLRGFRIDIETDSTIQPDEDAEKQRRTEFVTAIGGLIQQAVPLVMQVPEMAPLIGETLLFTARGFRAGRSLEDQIEQAMQSIQQRITQQQSQQPPDPNAPMLEAKKKQAEIDIQHTEAKNQLELQHKQEAHSLDMQMKQQQGEMALNSGRAKLREEILQSEGEAFMGPDAGEQVNGVAQVLQQVMAGLIETLNQSNQSVIASNAQVLQALTAPKIITAPDGRTYTAQTAMN